MYLFAQSSLLLLRENLNYIKNVDEGRKIMECNLVNLNAAHLSKVRYNKFSVASVSLVIYKV